MVQKNYINLFGRNKMTNNISLEQGLKYFRSSSYKKIWKEAFKRTFSEEKKVVGRFYFIFKDKHLENGYSIGKVFRMAN